MVYGMPKRVLLVKWGKQVDALEVDPIKETAHDVVSRRFDIPAARLSLICRGRKYEPGIKSTHALLDK